jgi:N-acetyl-S-(2-succino)cysteine monooxygenase
VMAPLLPQGMDQFIETVLPELRRRGLFRTEYEGTTLRENLGLPWPKSHEPRLQAAESRRPGSTDWVMKTSCASH